FGPQPEEDFMMSKRMGIQACVVLAAGALLGYVAASGRFLPRPAAAQEAKQPPEELAIITFTVRLPADAILLIDEDKTTSTGDVRTFQTLPVAKGKHYVFTLKATSQGKEVTRRIDLAHGVDNSFDLRAEFRTAATAGPDAKRLVTYGAAANGAPV